VGQSATGIDPPRHNAQIIADADNSTPSFGIRDMGGS